MLSKMGLRLSSWNLILHLVLLFLCAYRSGARELTEKQLQEVNKIDGHVHGHGHGHGHHSSHIDQREMIFFTLNDLKVGKKMPIYFERNNPSTSPHFLPRDEADSIPFSLKQLPQLLEFFSFPYDSPQAKAMEDALRLCETDPIEGEIKFCANSLESLLDFARSIFGLETDFKSLSNNYITKPTAIFQNYTILDVPKEIPAPKSVACHTLSYPYSIFACHSQMTENKVFSVLLGGDNGDRVEAISVCHMDTSHWNPNHVSFRVLGIEPGTSHVCHFFPADNLLFVPVSTTA